MVKSLNPTDFFIINFDKKRELKNNFLTFPNGHHSLLAIIRAELSFY